MSLTGNPDVLTTENEKNWNWRDEKKKTEFNTLIIQNPIASTTPLKSVAPLKKKWFRMGTSLWETALMISWAKTPPTTAAVGLSSPNTILEKNWKPNFLDHYQTLDDKRIRTQKLHFQQLGHPVSFRAEYDLVFRTISASLSRGLLLLDRV